MTPARSCFLDAPREIRDLIYEFYVATEDGYIYDFESGKLRNSDGRPINLSLMYTCRSVAAEMRGLALGRNTITVSTHETEEWAARVRVYHLMCMHTSRYQGICVGAALGSMVATNTREQMAQEFPWFPPLIDAAIRSVDPGRQALSRRNVQASFFYGGTTGHAPSLQHQATARALELASAAGQQFVDEISELIDIDRKVFWDQNFSSPLAVVKLGYLKPWILPTEELLADLNRRHPFGQRIRLRNYKKNTVRLSAAAICAHFLAQTPAAARSQMRRIVLNEDLPSLRGLHPECHAQGLIPYCRENPRLRVERRVSIWNVVVHGSVYTSNPPADVFGEEVALWIVEAHDLAALGMPAGSFSLLLDGDPIPEHSAHLFQTVLHRDVAWQQVIAAWQKLKPQTLPIEWNMSFDDLPGIMQDIALGKSNVRCNFDPGWPVDFRPILEEHRGSTRLDFKKAHHFREPRRLNTAPPLPDFRTLHYEVILGSPCPPMTQREIEREQESHRLADIVTDDQ